MTEWNIDRQFPTLSFRDVQSTLREITQRVADEDKSTDEHKLLLITLELFQILCTKWSTSSSLTTSEREVAKVAGKEAHELYLSVLSEAYPPTQLEFHGEFQLPKTTNGSLARALEALGYPNPHADTTKLPTPSFEAFGTLLRDQAQRLRQKLEKQPLIFPTTTNARLAEMLESAGHPHPYSFRP